MRGGGTQSPIQYNIQYHNHISDDEIADLPTTHMSNQNTSIANPKARTGFTFLGWYSDIQFAGSPTTELRAGVSYPLTIDLYGNWSADSYLINYELDGGEFVNVWGEPISYPTMHTYGQDTILVEPEKDEHIFIGWYETDTPDLVNDKITVLPGTQYMDTITLYAKWTQACTLFFYDIDGNPDTSIEPIKHINGSQTLLPIPNYDGLLQFIGWYTESKGVGQIFTDIDSDQILQSNIHLFANYTNPDLEYTQVSIDDTNGNPVEGYQINLKQSILQQNTITDIEIPKYYNGLPIIKIADLAFWNQTLDEESFSSIINIKAPDSLIEIGARAFDSTQITSFTLPDSVQKIDDLAFDYCTALEIFTITKQSVLHTIGSLAFSETTKLSKIFIPITVQNIGRGAFQKSISMTINCQALSQPSGWDPYWSSQGANHLINWGYTGN